MLALLALAYILAGGRAVQAYNCVQKLRQDGADTQVSSDPRIAFLALQVSVPFD